MYRLVKTKIDGCIELKVNVFEDDRGVTMKPFHVDEYNLLGIPDVFKEDLMVTSRKGVLRGLHFQSNPFSQAKLIYCAKGSVYDVAVDIRKNSPTYGEYVDFVIDAKKHNLAYIPVGFAHGYQVLEDDTTVIYKMSSIYSLDHEGGIRWDSLGIDWPMKNPVLSDKDILLPKFEDFTSSFNY
ncbi:MAG: dTDP-4-dehydrorhamnose 3,5-epimerase [Acetobacterium woodii]|nr:dTDP-4-dehydrorhamnose 3,5-epimerase [Acetobacterium woodii]